MATAHEPATRQRPGMLFVGLPGRFGWPAVLPAVTECVRRWLFLRCFAAVSTIAFNVLQGIDATLGLPGPEWIVPCRLSHNAIGSKRKVPPDGYRRRLAPRSVRSSPRSET